MTIRTATPEDSKAIAEIERICFPEAEAAKESTIQQRLAVFPGHFWLLEDNGKLVSFINGMVTNEATIHDEMFEKPNLHDERGDWQAIFGVCTTPEYQGRSCAARLMEHVIEQVRAQGRKGCILTCKEHLIPYYERFGYENMGVSQSTHGDAVWYNMTLEF